MIGGDVIGFELVSVFDEGFKFDFFVVDYVWVWCLFFFEFINEVGKDLVLVFFFEVNWVVWNFNLGCYFGNVFIVFCCGINFVFIGVVLVFYKNFDNIVILLF